MTDSSFLHLAGDLRITLTEWIPMGAQSIKLLQDKFECHREMQQYYVTSIVDREPNSAVFCVRDEEVSFKVVDYHPMEDLSLECSIHYAETGGDIQTERLGVRLTANGEVTYGAALDDVYSLDDIARITADLVTDTSQALDTILSAYQRQLLKVVFFQESRHRDKFLLVTAREIRSAEGPVGDIDTLFRNAAYRAELRQVLGDIDESHCAVTDDGARILVGSTGIMILGEGIGRRSRALRVLSLMGSMSSFIDNVQNRISHAWESLYNERKRIAGAEIEQIMDIQTKLSNLQADQGLLSSVPPRIEADAPATHRRYLELAREGEISDNKAFAYLVAVFDRARELAQGTTHELTTLGNEITNVRQLAGALTDEETFEINKRMNLLSVISFIVLPLTLVTGIYGMNFFRYGAQFEQEWQLPWNMPELYTEYGYVVVLGIMFIWLLVSGILMRRQIADLFKQRRKRTRL